jgi:collagen type IV alpha-3-binding protein
MKTSRSKLVLLCVILQLLWNVVCADNAVDKGALMREVEQLSAKQLRKSKAGQEDGGWELFVNDGELKMYTMENEEDGIAIDPLKAVHSVKGISGREYIDTFFNPDLKAEWDHTLDNGKVVERFSRDLVVIHQIHKRVWPASRRESLFWSFRQNVSDHRDADALDAWMMTSHDTERDDVPLDSSSNIRVRLTISMLAQTVVLPHAQHKSIKELTRDDILCRIAYIAQIHPGGWLPAVALRQVYKREYPKFLREFTEYAANKVRSDPLLI